MPATKSQAVGESQLEALLQGHLAEAAYDSSGRFTLARQQALEKLASFELPEASSWLLKVVQAAVASGSPQLAVRQGAMDTHFVFQPAESWTPASVEDALYDPEPACLPGLDHLKRALWSVSLNQRRPFLLVFKDHDEALIWRSEGSERLKVPRSSETALTVSHRSFEQGKGLPLLRHIEGARTNAELLLLLRDRAHVCPVPLSVDGRRLDALQAHPARGHSKNSFPFFIGLSHCAGAPELPVPQATWGDYRPDNTGNLHQEVRAVKLSHPSAACMLSFGANQVTRNKKSVWELAQVPSTFNWVLDGVIVSSEIHDIQGLPVSGTVYASAADLKLDLTGFKVLRTPESRQRKHEICRSLLPTLEQAHISLETLIGNARKGGRILGAVLGVGGLCTITVSPLHSLALLGMSVVSTLGAGQDEVQLQENLRQSLLLFQSQWARLNYATHQAGGDSQPTGNKS